MSKPIFRPIAMRCNKKQFESVRDILSEGGMEIDNISNNWDDLSYLVNNYDCKSKVVTNAYPTAKRSYGRIVFGEWNKDIFLEYCGIQSLPKKWAIKACSEVADWLDKNADPSAKSYDMGKRSYKHSSFEHFIYPLYDRSHIFHNPPSDYTKITIEQFREITKTNKPMSQKLTVPVTDILEIHKIACMKWKSTIGKYLSRVDENQNITFTQDEVDKMFSAATAEQMPVLIRIFGEKKAIDYDKITTGSKVMLTGSGQSVDVNKDVDLTKPFDVVFFKSSWVINKEGRFAGWKMYETYCTFHQDGKYVVFASHVSLDYILSVIEY